MATWRFHAYSTSFSYKAGRWYVSLSGVAAAFHHQRRSAEGRHPVPVGADRGVKSLIVAAGADGTPYGSWEGVRPPRQAEAQLRRANQALARTKQGSAGRARAMARLAKPHKAIADQRAHVSHQASYDLATGTTVLCTEDLAVAGMMEDHCLAKSLADAAMGEAGRRLGYKSAWYVSELHLADRWFASSKICSRLGHKEQHLDLSERTYRCEHCGLVIDRDLSAAINLARWPELNARAATGPPLPRAA